MLPRKGVTPEQAATAAVTGRPLHSAGKTRRRVQGTAGTGGVARAAAGPTSGKPNPRTGRWMSGPASKHNIRPNWSYRQLEKTFGPRYNAADMARNAKVRRIAGGGGGIGVTPPGQVATSWDWRRGPHAKPLKDR